MNTHDESHDHEHAQESHEHHEHHHSSHPDEPTTPAEATKPDVTRETVSEWSIPNPDAPDAGAGSPSDK